MKPIGHVMILASAGSGKTYALTNRFVKLLALGAAPERIVALTFTRKAAGEFFDEILNKLARAATDEVFAVKLANEIGWRDSGGQVSPAAARTLFLQMLRQVVDAMPRLQLGTLDGFFARIASNFPLELGLAGEFEILPEHSAQVERGRVLRRMFQGAAEAGVGPAHREFLEAFKRATFGVDEKRLGAQLESFLERHQEIFLTAPAADVWGNVAHIWPGGADWHGASARRETALQTLRAALAKTDLNEKQKARWEAFFAEFTTWSPGAPMGAALEYLFGNALKAWPELAEIVVERKKLALSEPARGALRDVLLAIFELEFARRVEMTRGIREVLASYERVYHDAVRRAGKLTFGDVQRLLQPGAGAPLLSVGDGWSGGGNDRDDGGRLMIDFRLDGQIDHWLLDEFQDTSFGQWSVLRNLIDEVVQDTSRTRSFFYVGDVKQAIFTWREGDPRLFREIFNHYNERQPGAISEEHLVQSWRSGPAVIAAVNQVLGDAAALSELFPGAATKTWNAEWRAHASARPQLGGQVALLHGEDEVARFAIALAVLQEIDPVARGLTCAVLVQGNATAARLAEYLRQEGGLPAVAESDLHVCIDNPLGAALLGLVKAAAHPGDTLAWGHVRMTPLRGLLEEWGGTPEAVTRHVLGQIHRDGFERAVAEWIRWLEPKLVAGDDFTRERARQFVGAARLFDETGSRDVWEFIQFMERHTIRETESAGVVRVMTIHKSKGLGFDVVVLPDLEGVRLDCRRDGLAVEKTPGRQVRWVLDLPPKLFHANDPVLAEHVRAAEADACYEALSLLYVAMTRAKRAMYLVTKAPGASTSRNYPKLLAETLGEETRTVRIGRREFAGAYEEGNADWFADLTIGAPPEEDVPIRPLSFAPGVRGKKRSLAAKRPSRSATAGLSREQLFGAQRREAAGFGTTLHELFAGIEWLPEDGVSALERDWGKRGVEAAARKEAVACLLAPELREVWERPVGLDAGMTTEVWRERTFEVVIDDAWITGVFDRVVVQRTGRRATRAIVYDFKTDQVVATGKEMETLIKRHAEQLNLYRRVVAVLTGLPTEKVRAVLISTKLRRGADVPLPH